MIAWSGAVARWVGWLGIVAGILGFLGMLARLFNVAITPLSSLPIVALTVFSFHPDPRRPAASAGDAGGGGP